MIPELESLRMDVASLTLELLDRYEEITLLYDLAQDMGTVLSFEDASRIGLARSLEVVPAELGLVLVGGEIDDLRVVVTSGSAGPDDHRARTASAAAAEVLRSGSLVMTEGGGRLGCGAIIPEAVLAAPVRVPEPSMEGGRTVGVLVFVGHRHDDRFTAADAQLGALVAGQLGQGIRNARVIKELRDKERLEGDLDLAAGIQRSLLPAHPPVVPGAAFAATCLPAALVGGDYYDFLTDTSGAVSVLVADVAGHGFGPGLIMAMTRSVLRAELRRAGSLADALQATNAVMWDDLVATEAFITLFAARYEPTTQQLHYANAGHQPALLRHADGTIEELDSDGMPLGISASPPYEERMRQLTPGDLVLIFSDGVVEASSPADVALGMDGLAALLAASPTHSADETVAQVLSRVADLRAGKSQDDDITIVALQVDDPTDVGRCG